MSKSVKNLIIIIGSLSILSGLFLVYRGSDFSEYFSGILLGIVLVGSALFYKEETEKKEE
jgi:uncharacterized membrane protein